MTAFAVNAALVVSQHCTRIVSLHPLTNTKYKVATIKCDVFSMTWLEPSLPALVEHVQVTVPLDSSSY